MLASMSRVRRDAVLRLKNALRRSLGQGRYDWAKRMVRDPLVAVWSASRQGIATSRKQIWRSVPEK
jgi:hypothetical protein